MQTSRSFEGDVNITGNTDLDGTLNVDGVLTLPTGRLTPRTVTIADDAVAVITPASFAGIVFVSTETDSAIYGSFAFRAASTPFIQNTGTSVVNFDRTTGALTGTTGVDGRATISVHTDGNIYLENRRGGSLNFKVFILA